MNYEFLFKPKQYLEAYPELPYKKRKGAWYHFQNFGWKENRYAAFKNKNIFNDYVKFRKEQILYREQKMISEDKTIYIMGNGPSLGNINFDDLKNVDTFGLNSAYKKYSELNFYPTYFGCFDPILIEYHYAHFINLIKSSPILKFYFLNENTKKQSKQFNIHEENHPKYQKINFLPPKQTYHPSSFDNFYKLQNSGATAAVISILLGYKKIILLGCDCNYVEHINESKLIDKNKKNTSN